MSKAPKNTDVKQGSEDLEARLVALRAEIDEIMAALAEKAQAEAEEAAQSAADNAEDIGEEVLKEARRALNQIHKQASSLEKTLGVQTRANPLQTLAIAFGAGFIVSLLMTRR